MIEPARKEDPLYLEHTGISAEIAEGKLSLVDLGLLTLLLLKSDPSSHSVFTNAPQLAFETRVSSKMIQAYLVRLEKKGWITRMARPRSRALYEILLQVDYLKSKNLPAE